MIPTSVPIYCRRERVVSDDRRLVGIRVIPAGRTRAIRRGGHWYCHACGARVAVAW